MRLLRFSWLTVGLLCSAAGCRDPRNAAKQLCQAVEEGDLVRVQRLIGHGADVNGEVFDDVTALHRAAGKGHKDIIESLVAQGAGARGQGAAQAAVGECWCRVGQIARRREIEGDSECGS